MLGLSPELVYIHEPFNVNYPHELVPRSFNRWYEYIPPTCEGERHDDLRRVVNLYYPLWYHLSRSQSLGEVVHCLRSSARYVMSRLLGRSVLLKDPLALLSAEWVAERFDLEVLVLIRHPAGFAGSLKKKEWTFPFEDLLAQDRLMEEHLSPFAEEIEAFANTEQDVVDQAALLWTVLYTVVSAYQDQHPEWTFLRHEDVARQPIETFRALYEQFGLDFTGSVRAEIEAHSKSSGEGGDELRRKSRSVIRNWEQRLSTSEINRVRKQTRSVACEFYSDDDW